jgi:hypothetical protein
MTAVPAPKALSDDELADAIRAGGRLRGPAMFELIDRGHDNPASVETLGTVALFEPLRDERLFHLVSFAWAAIIGLLSIETVRSRQLGYQAFGALPKDDQASLLRYLKAQRIEDSHPQL